MLTLSTYRDDYPPGQIRWRAEISGNGSPWYTDSDPEGYGPTEQEAIKAAIKSLMHFKEEIDTFLETRNKVNSNAQDSNSIERLPSP